MCITPLCYSSRNVANSAATLKYVHIQCTPDYEALYCFWVWRWCSLHCRMNHRKNIEVTMTAEEECWGKPLGVLLQSGRERVWGGVEGLLGGEMIKWPNSGKYGFSINQKGGWEVETNSWTEKSSIVVTSSRILYSQHVLKPAESTPPGLQAQFFWHQ